MRADAERTERGAVGGLEALPFSVLIFVCGSLMILNAWAVVDTKMAVTAAAREAARTYSEAQAPGPGRRDAARAAREAYSAHGHDPDRLRVSGPTGALARCGRVEATARAVVPAIRIPLVADLGRIEVRSTHRERVDDLRTGLPGEAVCGG